MSTSQINRLSERIARSDPRDAGEQAKILQELVALRDVMMQLSSSRDLVGCFDAAATLLRHVPQVAPSAAEEVQRLVGRLLDAAVEAVPDDQEEPAPEASAPQPRVAEPEPLDENGDLRLINDMLLGEIMIQLGTITREKIDAALKIQQATDMRVGEALVHLGAASWQEIDNGLKLQEHLTGAKSGSLRVRPEEMGQPRVTHEGGDRPPVQAFDLEHLNVIADMTLGEEMIRMGAITRAQLEEALQAQCATGQRLGEALVDVGAATWDEVAEGVRMQQLHREKGGGPSLDVAS